MPAQVAWRQGFQAGIAFDRELPETFVALFAEGQVMVEVDRSLPSVRWGSRKASLPPVEAVLGRSARLV